MKLEIRNESDGKIYVALCRSMLGDYFLHVDSKKSKHIPLLVKPYDYLIINEPTNDDVV